MPECCFIVKVSLTAAIGVNQWVMCLQVLEYGGRHSIKVFT